MKNKIVIFIDSPGFGGSEVNAIKLIQLLSNSHNVELMFSKYVCQQLLDVANILRLNYYFFDFPNTIFFSIYKFFNLLKITNSDSFYIVWCHHLDSNRWVQLVLALRSKEFLVVEQLLPTSYVVLNNSKLSRPIKKFVCCRAKNIVLCGYSQKSSYDVFFNCYNSLVIPNTRAIKSKGFRKNLLSNEYLRKEVIKICCVGRLTNQKDQQSLIRAISFLKYKNHVNLNLVGDGENKSLLSDLAVNIGDVDVNFLGHVDNVDQILFDSDIFVLPSLSEGLPGALIEAMSMCIPCIATNIPGNNELIINNFSGLLVPTYSPESIAKAIDFIVYNPALIEEMVDNAYDLVKTKYDDSVFEKAWLDYLHGVVRKK